MASRIIKRDLSEDMEKLREQFPKKDGFTMKVYEEPMDSCCNMNSLLDLVRQKIQLHIDRNSHKANPYSCKTEFLVGEALLFGCSFFVEIAEFRNISKNKTVIIAHLFIADDNVLAMERIEKYEHIANPSNGAFWSPLKERGSLLKKLTKKTTRKRPERQLAAMNSSPFDIATKSLTATQ